MPFGCTALANELGLTGDTPMADDIYTGTLEHRSLIDRAIKAIVTQLCKNPLLAKMINPVVTTEDFISCFGCVAEKISSSSSGRHAGNYIACIDLKDELPILLAMVHAVLMYIPLAEGFCPKRWRQSVSGITLAALLWIGYSKNSVRMLGLMWAQLEHHVTTGFGVSDTS
jgi:hypothetical protein